MARGPGWQLGLKNVMTAWPRIQYVLFRVKLAEFGVKARFASVSPLTPEALDAARVIGGASVKVKLNTWGARAENADMVLKHLLKR